MTKEKVDNVLKKFNVSDLDKSSQAYKDWYSLIVDAPTEDLNEMMYLQEVEE